MLQKRQEYKEKTKNALVFQELPSERQPKKGKGRRTDQYISDSDSGQENREGGETKEKKERSRKRKRSNDRKEKKRRGGGKYIIFIIFY